MKYRQKKSCLSSELEPEPLLIKRKIFVCLDGCQRQNKMVFAKVRVTPPIPFALTFATFLLSAFDWCRQGREQ